MPLFTTEHLFERLNGWVLGTYTRRISNRTEQFCENWRNLGRRFYPFLWQLNSSRLPLGKEKLSSSLVRVMSIPWAHSEPLLRHFLPPFLSLDQSGHPARRSLPLLHIVLPVVMSRLEQSLPYSRRAYIFLFPFHLLYICNQDGQVGSVCTI